MPSAVPTSKSSVVERDVVQRLAVILRADRWKVEVAPRSSGAFGPDLQARRGSLRYVAQVKVAGELRRPVIEGLFANAIVQARVYATQFHGRPLAIIAAPRISSRMRTEIAEYAERFAPDVAWGILDADGGGELHGDGLVAIVPPAAGRPQGGHEVFSQRRSDLFSDLGQWMIKVLLAPRLEPKYLGAPRAEVITASRLAEVASVSLPTASRHLIELRNLGYVDESRRDLRLVRVAELLQSWRAATVGRVEEVRARWLIPPKDAVAHIDRVIAEANAADQHHEIAGGKGTTHRRRSRACLGLFAASTRLGFRFVHGAPLYAYLEDLSISSLESLGLEPAGLGQRFDVVVRRPRFPESLFRGCVVGKHAPVSDLVKCWIDVSDHPARGAELADQLWRRVLAPCLVAEADA